MRNGEKSHNTKSLPARIVSGLLVFGFAFSVSYLSSSHFAPVTRSDAVTGAYYVNITSSGNVNLAINATPDGAYKVGKDSLTIGTNTTVGYKLFINTMDHSGDSPALPSATPSNSLIGSTDNTKYLPPSSGSIASPVRLATNTWGYTVSRANSTDSSVAYTDTDAAPTEAAGGQAVWRAVPEYDAEDLFYTNTTPTTSSTNSIDVYYAANANTAFPSGTYVNTVIYTALAEGNTPNTSSSNPTISPTSQSGLIGGQSVTINTGLYPNLSSSTASELASFLGNINISIGSSVCTSPTPSLDSTSGNLVITCNTPTQYAYTTYNVSITIPKLSYSKTIPSSYEYTAPPSTDIAFFNITKMQEMTHAICTDSNLPTPSASETTTLTASAWASGSRTGIPTTILLDDRTGQVRYVVKKLADGKCWMTENLALPAGAVLTASDSDLDGTVVSSYTLPSSRAPFTSPVDTSPAQDAEEMYDPAAGGGITTTNPEYYSYKVGNYYSWRTATAGTGRGSHIANAAINDPFGQNMSAQDINTLVSICPKGWRLPTGGAANGGTTGITTPGSATNLVNGDFTVLVNAYGGWGYGSNATVVTQLTDPSYGPNLAFSGYVDKIHGQYNINADGYFWSSSVRSAYDVYLLYVSRAYYNGDSIQSKSLGVSVRCVAR